MTVPCVLCNLRKQKKRLCPEKSETDRRAAVNKVSAITGNCSENQAKNQARIEGPDHRQSETGRNQTGAKKWRTRGSVVPEEELLKSTCKTWKTSSYCLQPDRTDGL